MRTVIVRNGTRIPLGKQGENNAVRVVWPEITEKYAKLYGDGRFELVVVQKGQAYPAVVSVDGADLVWDVLAADVATVGAGSLELIYYVGDTIAKSQTWETFVVASRSAEGTTEPPDPSKNWVDTVLKSSSDAKQAATESAESAKQAAASREAIENMEASAVSLPPNSKATVEKDLVEGKVKLTFGIPRGESDIFWLNTASDSSIAETFDEIVAAYKAGKSIWVRDTHSFSGGVLTAPEFIAIPVGYDEDGIDEMVIVCGGSAYSSSELIGTPDGITNVTYYIKASPEKVTSTMIVNNDVVSDVQINGSSIVGVSGVAAVPILATSPLANPSYGLPTLADGNTPVGIGLHLKGSLMTIPAKRGDITNRKERDYFDTGVTGSDFHFPICPGYLDYSVKAAMCDGKGAAWTDVERLAALLRMGCTVDDNGFVKWTAQEVTE